MNLIRQWKWKRAKVTGNITVATVVYIVDERTNQTRISTKTNSLPAGITSIPTNAAGTHTSKVTIETAPGRNATVEV
jgi:hypothetical protein